METTADSASKILKKMAERFIKNAPLPNEVREQCFGYAKKFSKGYPLNNCEGL